MAWPVRYNIVGLLTLGTMVNYMDRVNISVAAPDIMRQTGWDQARFGLVFSAFLVGYALFQVPGGVIADRWSARKVLALSCLGFSFFTALTPLGQSTFLVLLLMRFLVGACESASLPSLASLNSRWVPRQEYGRAQTFSISGASLGQMVAYPTTAWLIETFSWPVVFYVNAAIGIVWMGLWLAYSTDTPREHSSISTAELQEIERGLVPKSQRTAVPLRALLKSPVILFLCLSYMLFGFIAWIFILWFPSYLVEARGLSRMHMGLVGMLPTGASFLGIIAGGVVSDSLLRRGVEHPERPSAVSRVVRGTLSPLPDGGGDHLLNYSVSDVVHLFLLHPLARGLRLLVPAAGAESSSGRGHFWSNEHGRQLCRYLWPFHRRCHRGQDRELGAAVLSGRGAGDMLQPDLLLSRFSQADNHDRTAGGCASLGSDEVTLVLRQCQAVHRLEACATSNRAFSKGGAAILAALARQLCQRTF
ncbi:MAG: MFS transporter [Deltaproteobacteria bacterium]|nr:MFS transporter [Deltaproteobacteria bacterium]